MHVQHQMGDVELPEDLPDTTIVILGLMEMGYTDLALIAEILHVNRIRPLRRLLKMLKTSRNPVIRRCVDVGLPPGMFREFPYHDRSVRCPLCGGMVKTAPCAKCATPFGRHATEEFPRECVYPAPEATTAEPGTLRKIAVLRMRLERGEELFHNNDMRRAGGQA